jgi:hypothetical protein
MGAEEAKIRMIEAANARMLANVGAMCSPASVSYAEQAEVCLAAAEAPGGDKTLDSRAKLLAAAQVYATLSNAAATSALFDLLKSG